MDAVERERVEMAGYKAGVDGDVCYQGAGWSDEKKAAYRKQWLEGRKARAMKTKKDYTSESTTYIRFPSDYVFSLWRDGVVAEYSDRVVKVARHMIVLDPDKAGTVAKISHARGLGSELRGSAHRNYGAVTVDSHNERIG